MDKCPYCGAETRPGDNFCLNCGNRLVPTSFPAQSHTEVGGDTQAASEEWNAAQQGQNAGPASASGPSWSNASDPTMADAPGDLPTQRSSQPSSMDGIEHPARFVLRSDDGTIIQEYPLDKPEIAIGRAPNSDILLSKDKLTSRRHATVRYENGNYVLRDERSANGTFVNGQQIEEMIPRVLQEGDHVGIGEHELLFRSYNSSSTSGVEDLPTVSVGVRPEPTFSTHNDALATLPTSDQFHTNTMNNGSTQEEVQQVQQDQQDLQPQIPQPVAQEQEAQPVALVEDVQPQEEHAASSNGSAMPEAPAVATSIPVATAYATSSSSNTAFEQAAPIASAPPPVADTPPVTTAAAQSSVTTAVAQQPAPTTSTPATTNAGNDTNITFSRLTSVSQPSLPDMTALMAALSTLDGQVMSLQEQLNSTQGALQNHDAEIAQVTNQLRAGVRRVADRMDNTIADVARSREALAWADLSQLMEDVMNNPRDIEYVTKLARKARELNKIFQIHQNVLNTMYECNSLLRALIGEER